MSSRRARGGTLDRISPRDVAANAALRDVTGQTKAETAAKGSARLLAPLRRCPAPKILTATPCGRRLEPEQATCPAHVGTDPRGRCEADAGGGRRDAAPTRCHAWPLVGSTFCAPHDPVARAELQAERDSLTVQLAALRRHVRPEIAVKVLELLVVRHQVQLVDVTAACAEYRIGW